MTASSTTTENASMDLQPMKPTRKHSGKGGDDQDAGNVFTSPQRYLQHQQALWSYPTDQKAAVMINS
jgi:hypothetical protein